MIDSGSSVNMLRRDDLTQTERECIGKADNPLNISTTNWPITADEEMAFELKDLKIKDEAMILDHAPPVRSGGPKKHGCLVMTPGGDWRKATVSKYVPCRSATDIETLNDYIS